MTKKEAEKLGRDRGQSRAERVCLEPAFHLLPPILEKWSKRKTWFAAVDDEKELYDLGLDSLPLESAFERGFISTGQKWVRNYIKELIDDGLLTYERKTLSHKGGG